MNQTKRPIVRVIKIGGSLLDMPDLPERLGPWVEGQGPGWNVHIIGGGRMADEIRQADERYELGEEVSHWLCVDVLRTTARLGKAILRGLPLLESWPSLPFNVARNERMGSIVFDPYEFLHDYEAKLPGLKLPHTWEATSDSIAARIAILLEADELVLFKADPRASDPASIEQKAAQGIIDPFLPKLAARLPPIRFLSPPR